jgi:hypothetical protein
VASQLQRVDGRVRLEDRLFLSGLDLDQTGEDVGEPQGVVDTEDEASQFPG